MLIYYNTINNFLSNLLYFLQKKNGLDVCDNKIIFFREHPKEYAVQATV